MGAGSFRLASAEQCENRPPDVAEAHCSLVGEQFARALRSLLDKVPGLRRLDPPQDVGGGMLRVAEIADGSGASLFAPMHERRVAGLRDHCPACGARPNEACRGTE